MLSSLSRSENGTIRSAPLFDLDFRTVAIVWNHETDALSFMVDMDWNLLLVNKYSSLRWCPAVDLGTNLLPPGRIGAQMLTKNQMQAPFGPLTAKLHLQKGSMLICEGVPVIEVELTRTLITDKDTERESSLWSLIRALNHRRDGQY